MTSAETAAYLQEGFTEEFRNLALPENLASQYARELASSISTATYIRIQNAESEEPFESILAQEVYSNPQMRS